MGHATGDSQSVSLGVSHHKEQLYIWFRGWDMSFFLCVLGFNDTSTLAGHFVSSPREREKRDSRGDEKEGQGRKTNRNEIEETEEIKTYPLYPYLLQG